MDNSNAPSSFDYFGKTPKGVEMALHIQLEDMTLASKAEGIVAYIKGLDAALADAGFTRSERLDKPVRSGGGGGGGGTWKRPQQDDPLPPGIDAPEHDGEKMAYKADKEVFECRKQAECSDPREYNGKKYGKSMWLSEVRKKQAKAKVRDDDGEFPNDDDF